MLRGNRFAWECFQHAVGFQYRTSGFGDFTLDGRYMQEHMADRGVKGPERAWEMEKVRVLTDELHKMQKIREDAKKGSIDTRAEARRAARGE